MRKAKDYSYLENIEDSFWSYLAGIVDGEGTILVRKKLGRNDKNWCYQGMLSVAQSNFPFLDYIRNELGGLGAIYPRGERGSFGSPTSRSTFEWKLYSKQALAVAEKLLPYLRIKKLQAEGLVELERSIGNHSGKSLSQSDLEYREWIKQRISDLNQGVLEVTSYD